MFKIPNPLSKDQIIDIAEGLNCTSKEFYEKLIKKAVLIQISKIKDSEIFDTEATINQQTNFPYIILKNENFYFVRINFENIPHGNKITREKTKLESILGLKSSGILCFNPHQASPKGKRKKLKNIGYELHDLRFDKRFLNNLIKLRGINYISPNPTLEYVPGTGYFKLKSWQPKKEDFNYCLGETHSKTKKRKCKKGEINELKKYCAECPNYVNLIRAQNTYTTNIFNRYLIERLENLKTDNQYIPTNTELSKLARILL